MAAILDLAIRGHFFPLVTYSIVTSIIVTLKKYALPCFQCMVHVYITIDYKITPTISTSTIQIVGN